MEKLLVIDQHQETLIVIGTITITLYQLSIHL